MLQLRSFARLQLRGTPLPFALNYSMSLDVNENQESSELPLGDPTYALV
jgi:hypothetical protein